MVVGTIRVLVRRGRSARAEGIEPQPPVGVLETVLLYQLSSLVSARPAATSARPGVRARCAEASDQ